MTDARSLLLKTEHGTIVLSDEQADHCVGCSATEELVTLRVDAPTTMLVAGICGDCLAEALAIFLGRCYVESGGKVGDLTAASVNTAASVKSEDPINDPSFQSWMRARPPEIQAGMRLWPPGTRVKAKPDADLKVPAQGITGRVVSWFEDGNVGVVAEGGGNLRGECDPGWLEVVEYAVLTPAQVAEILDAEGEESKA